MNINNTNDVGTEDKTPLLRGKLPNTYHDSHPDLPTFAFHPPTNSNNNSSKMPKNVSFSLPASSSANASGIASSKNQFPHLPQVEYDRQKPPHLQSKQKKKNNGYTNLFSDDTNTDEDKFIQNDDEDDDEYREPWFTRHITNNISKLVDRIQEFSFIAILMVYSGTVSFIFAIILFCLQPPTKVTYVQYNISSNTSSSSSNDFIGFLSDNNNSSSNTSAPLERVLSDPISFVDAIFMAFGSFSGTGLSVVNYSIWDSHTLAFLCFTITMGSYVLLTLLPAVFRYRALCKEREKLIRILDWTGAYQSEEVKRRNRQREQEQERQRVVLEQQAREKQRQAQDAEEAAETITKRTTDYGSYSSMATVPPSASPVDHDEEEGMSRAHNINASTVTSAESPVMKQETEQFASSPTTIIAPRKKKRLPTDLILSHQTSDPRKAATMILNYTGEHQPQDDAQNAAAMVITSNSLKTNLTSSSVNSLYGLSSPTSSTYFTPGSTGASASTGAGLFPSPKQVERMERRKKRQAKKIAKSLTFGKRIVYEDGLAHVNQQIDICLIIIFSVLFYWFSLHFILISLCVAGGKPLSWSIFHVVSAFNNAGLTLSSNSMIPIDKDIWLMFVLIMAMLLGNPLFPVFFRFQLSLFHRLLRRITTFGNHRFAKSMVFGQPLIVWQHSVRLLLRYPRKYYTHVFSIFNTFLLFMLWFAFTVAGMVLFGLEWNAEGLFAEGSTNWEKFWVALFQSVSVRSTGFNIVDLNYVQEAHLVFWILAQYLSAFPFIITVRATQYNYEYDEDDPDNLGQAGGGQQESSSSTAADLRREATNILGRDLFWLYCAVFLICYAERASLRNPSHDYSLFLRITFEVSSAFGNVGLSLSLPDADTSYSGSMCTFSVWVMICVMFLGKHRNLPQTLDDAIAINVRTYDFSRGDLDPDFSSSSSSCSDEENNNNKNDGMSKNTSTGGTTTLVVVAPTNSSSNVSGTSSKSRVHFDDEKKGSATTSSDLHHLDTNDDKLLQNFDNSTLGIPKLKKKIAWAKSDQDLLVDEKQFMAEEDKALGIRHDHNFESSSPSAAASSSSPASSPTANVTNTSLTPPKPNQHHHQQQKSILKDADSTFFLDENGELVKMSKKELFRRRVAAFYEHYNPARLPHLDRILNAFEHNPKALLRNLATTYGQEPMTVSSAKTKSTSSSTTTKKS